MFRINLWALAAALWALFFLAGCMQARLAEAVALTLAERSPGFQEIEGDVEGEVHDPSYFVEVFVVQKTGVEVAARTQGIDLIGRLVGRGSGEGQAWTPEGLANLRARLGDDAFEKFMRWQSEQAEPAPMEPVQP